MHLYTIIYCKIHNVYTTDIQYVGHTYVRVNRSMDEIARAILQAGLVRRVKGMTAQASTIAMATGSVLAQIRVSVQRAGVDRAASIGHAG